MGQTVLEAGADGPADRFLVAEVVVARDTWMRNCNCGKSSRSSQSSGHVPDRRRDARTHHAWCVTLVGSGSDTVSWIRREGAGGFARSGATQQSGHGESGRECFEPYGHNVRTILLVNRPAWRHHPYWPYRLGVPTSAVLTDRETTRTRSRSVALHGPGATRPRM